MDHYVAQGNCSNAIQLIMQLTAFLKKAIKIGQGFGIFLVGYLPDFDLKMGLLVRNLLQQAL
jgi:hypothetical protein